MDNVIPLRPPVTRIDRPGRCPDAELTVRCPSEPPSLSSSAASALLGILRAVAASPTRSATGRERAA